MAKSNEKELQRQIKELKDKLKQRSQVTFRVAKKGGASAYGLGPRYPTTLYYWQWMLLLDHADELRAFLEKNKSKLKMRDDDDSDMPDTDDDDDAEEEDDDEEE